MTESKGLRRKVKDGKMSVEEAHKWLDKQGCPSYFPIRGWLNRRR